jgi:hypothetical protein
MHSTEYVPAELRKALVNINELDPLTPRPGPLEEKDLLIGDERDNLQPVRGTVGNYPSFEGNLLTGRRSRTA